MEVRMLREEDWGDVYDLIRPFYDEGHWSKVGEFSPENITAYIIKVLTFSNVFGVYDHGEDSKEDSPLVGAASCGIVYKFNVRPEGHITDFYTSEDFRGRGAGRVLVEAIIEFCKKQNCGNIFAANTSRFTKEANVLHDNLFRKYGFEVVSNNLSRVM